jgi:glycosyltransferase involved in cell wall biosynthesis
VEAAAPRELAAALTRLLADPAERQRLGEAGRATVLGRHGWTAVTAQVAALYASLAGATTARA